MVMLSGDIVWPRMVRLANTILKSSAESERDAMLKLDFDAVKDLEPCVQSQPALVIAACDAARSAEKDSEGVTSETENDFDVSAEVSKIERVHEQQEADIKLAHELASDAARMSAFDAPLSPNISHFSSSGLCQRSSSQLAHPTSSTSLFTRLRFGR